MAKMAMPAEEKSWQAEHDLRSLIEAEQIKKDKARMRAAMKKRDEMKADLEKVQNG